MEKNNDMNFVKNKIFLFFNILILLILTICSFELKYSVSLSIINIIYIFTLNLFSILKIRKSTNFIQPILIINIFTIVMFCIRPLFLFFSDFSYVKSLSSALRLYSLVSGITNIRSLPNAFALYIISLSSFVFNYSYYLKNNINLSDREITIDDSKTKKYGLLVYIIFIFLFVGFFLFKFNISYLRQFAGRFHEIGIEFSFYDILWLYAFPFAIGYSYYISKKNNQIPFLSIFLLLIELYLLMILTRRSYIVNVFIILLLISYFYKGKTTTKNKKIGLKYIFYAILIFSLIIGLSEIRNQGQKYSKGDSGFVKILNEFDMYDMFVCTIDYYSYHENHYNGINYLSLPFIPKELWDNKPDYFDYHNSQIVLNGHFKAGIPTSLFGSLYLNFRLIGMVVSCLILGLLCNKFYRKFSNFNDIHGLMKYSIFLIFIYDFFRVGNFARELWSIMLYIFCFILCKKLLFVKEDNDEFEKKFN